MATACKVLLNVRVASDCASGCSRLYVLTLHLFNCTAPMMRKRKKKQIVAGIGVNMSRPQKTWTSTCFASFAQVIRKWKLVTVLWVCSWNYVLCVSGGSENARTSVGGFCVCRSLQLSQELSPQRGFKVFREGRDPCAFRPRIYLWSRGKLKEGGFSDTLEGRCV